VLVVILKRSFIKADSYLCIVWTESAN